LKQIVTKNATVFKPGLSMFCSS